MSSRQIAMLCRAAKEMPRSPRVRQISNVAASTRGFTTAALTAALQAFSIPITACAARVSSKDGQQTIRFRGGTNGSNLILSSGESAANSVSSPAEPMVRIRFPPGKSLRTIGS